MRWHQELELAKEVALEAGEILKKNLNDNKQVLCEEARDIKLKADQASEAYIVQQLEKNFKYPILSEEAGLNKDIIENEPYWIIDPLDGTFNYLNNIPLCAVSIALWKNNKPILGVINLFNFDELIYGVIGEGTFINEVKVNVKKGNKSIAQSSLATGFPLNLELNNQSLQRFLEFSKVFKKVRMLGSAATSLAYVAVGKVQVYWEEEIMIWDIAAGIALVEAAGGEICLRPGKSEWSYNVVSWNGCRVNEFINDMEYM